MSPKIALPSPSNSNRRVVGSCPSAPRTTTPDTAGDEISRACVWKKKSRNSTETRGFAAARNRCCETHNGGTVSASTGHMPGRQSPVASLKRASQTLPRRQRWVGALICLVATGCSATSRVDDGTNGSREQSKLVGTPDARFLAVGALVDTAQSVDTAQPVDIAVPAASPGAESASGSRFHSFCTATVFRCGDFHGRRVGWAVTAAHCLSQERAPADAPLAGPGASPVARAMVFGASVNAPDRVVVPLAEDSVASHPHGLVTSKVLRWRGDGDRVGAHYDDIGVVRLAHCPDEMIDGFEPVPLASTEVFAELSQEVDRVRRGERISGLSEVRMVGFGDVTGLRQSSETEKGLGILPPAALSDESAPSESAPGESAKPGMRQSAAATVTQIYARTFATDSADTRIGDSGGPNIFVRGGMFERGGQPYIVGVHSLGDAAHYSVAFRVDAYRTFLDAAQREEAAGLAGRLLPDPCSPASILACPSRSCAAATFRTVSLQRAPGRCVPDGRCTLDCEVMDPDCAYVPGVCGPIWRAYASRGGS